MPDTLAPSHLRLAVREAGAVADDAELRKTKKYSILTILSCSQWNHWGCLGRRPVLFEGVRATRKNVIRRPYGTTTSGAANISGCTKRECCCSAGEHWAEGRGLAVFWWWWCYSGGFFVVYCFIIIIIIISVNKK